MAESAWFVYVLRSTTMRSTYVGITTDPERRLDQHNGVQPGGARTTRRGRPWKIASIHGPYPTRGEALRIEHHLKSRRGTERLRWRPPAAEPTG